MWQYTDSGVVPGIDQAYVDLNIWLEDPSE
jgi:GH25 family lysozyme M1 (1,4-beta-N-acetylmuramidase)